MTMIVGMEAMRPAAFAVRLGANLTRMMVLVIVLCLMLFAFIIFVFSLFIVSSNVTTTS